MNGRLMRGASGSAGELGAADHGDFQFLCHELESPGDIRHFLHPVVLMLLALHELQVVDDDEAEVFHPAELGLHAGDGDARGVVDQDLGLREAGCRVGDGVPVLVVQIPGAELDAVDLGLGGEHTVGELFRRHFEVEDADGLSGLIGGLGGDVHGEGRLPHAGAGADQDEVRLAHADDDVVEGGESGGGAAEGFRIGGEGLEAVVDLEQGVADVDEVLVLPSLRDAVDPAFGVLHEGFGLVVPGVTGFGDVLPGGDQLAQYRPVPHDVRVVLRVDGGGDGLGDELEVFPAPGFGIGSRSGELVDEGHDVDVLRLQIHGLHGEPDLPVFGHIEIVGVHDPREFVHAPGVDHDRAEKGLLRFQRKRKFPVKFIIQCDSPSCTG